MKNNNNADKPSVNAVVDKTPPSSTIDASLNTVAKGWTESSSDWIAPPTVRSTAPRKQIASLAAKNLSVSYGSQQVLGDINFTLYQGDTLGLLGLNGAGKSTLLKVLSGAMAPNTGTVQIGNHELYEDIIQPRMNIGYAPDKPAVNPEFRVAEFLKFIARMRRIDRRCIKNSVDLIIGRCGLGEVRNRIIGNLSTGYQQRVNIAQALIHSPKILILDEPSNGLDPVQLMEIRELVTTLAPEQATLFSSHLLSEVNSICNRVMLINSGQQILDVPLASLANRKSRSFQVLISDQGTFNMQTIPGVSHAFSTTAGQWLVTGNSLTPEHLNAMLESRGQRVIQITAAGNYLESLFKQLATSVQTPDNNLTTQDTDRIETSRGTGG